MTCDASVTVRLGGSLSVKAKVKGKAKTTTAKLTNSKPLKASKMTITFKVPTSVAAALKEKVAGTLTLSVTDSVGAGTITATISRLK